LELGFAAGESDAMLREVSGESAEELIAAALRLAGGAVAEPCAARPRGSRPPTSSRRTSSTAR
jgi:hypothetical protein